MPVSDAPTSRLKVSREGIALIKSFEGFRPRAVRGDDGGWIIGYGHSAHAREGLVIREPDAELLLRYDLMPVAKALNEQVRMPLNQHQFDAIASFAVSIGIERFLASNVLERLNEGHADEAADALIGWPETPTLDVRLRRRAAERALFVADPAKPTALAELMIAPLPLYGPGAAAEPKGGPPRPAPADARAAAVAVLLGEDVPARQAPGQADAATATPGAGTPPAAPAHPHRYAPYAAAIIGPLPGFPAVEPTAPQPEPADTPTAAALQEGAGPEADAAPPVTVQSSSPGVDPVEAPASPSGGLDSDVTAEGGPASLDEPAAPVLRHETAPGRARRFDWAVTGAFGFIGLTGLVACGAAAAAFRKAMVDPAGLNDYRIIGAVLALIGFLCVAVSLWNLLVRRGRPD